MLRSLRALPATLLISLCAVSARGAVTVPASFIVENAVPGVSFVVPTSLAFLPDGRFIVCEKRGIVWMVEGGIRRATPVWSATSEVLDNSDRGLLDVAVDPDFVHNRYVYFLYEVDPDSDGVDTNVYSFGRLARYRMSASGDTNVVDPASRTVLMGTGWRTGPVDLMLSHAVGSLRWGRDGSLFVSDGDGADFNQPDPGGLQPAAFGPNLADPYQDIGAFRAQDITILNGKILRIDPLTGLGYPGNPYYDGDASSNRSKVWAYGLRNPFRFSLRPGTGVTDPAAGNPGVVYIGDVGWNNWEELDVVTQPGLNFGWPCVEGPATTSYASLSPAHNGCSSYGAATNPLAPRAPIVTWNHSNPALSQPPGIVGATCIGGAFYTASLYPTGYRGRYFFADYTQDWIKLALVDGNNNLVGLSDFGTSMGGPVALVTSPVQGDLYYVSINTGQVLHVRYSGPSGGGNTPPFAASSAVPSAGSAPLTVAFDGTASYDVDGDSLTYAWTFGDGGGSTVRNPSHTFTQPALYTAVLTVDDGRGGQDVSAIPIAVGSGSGFPTTAVLDNFNRANGAMGGNWGDANSALTINTSALTQTGAGWNDAVWLPSTFGPDQEAFLRLGTISPATTEMDLMLKVQGATWTSGLIEVRYDAVASQIALSTYDALAGWRTWLRLLNQHPAPGSQLGARAYSSGVVQIYLDGAVVGTASIAAWPFYSNGGRIGLELANASASRVDDFGGGDWVTSAAPVVNVVSPVGGESWTGGSAQVIRWAANAALGISGVDLFYRDGTASPWTPLALGETNSGAFTWFVPNTPTAHARVKVLAHAPSGGTGSDSSHADFTLTRPPGGLVPTTLRDFREPGTQPFEGGTFTSHDGCLSCHGGYDVTVEPGHAFRGTMMSQAARDPLFYACLAIAEQDAPASGDLCIRCHAPFAWLNGRSQPTSGARIDSLGRDGVSCDFCHRLVDPVYQPGVNPVQDAGVLALLPAHVPTTRSNGQYVLDPSTVKRGPFADAVAPHAFLASSFHTRSEMCATCHEVSNPVYTRAGEGKYVPGPFDTPADSISSLTLMPLERTYSEWKNSAFPAGVYAPDFGPNAPGGIVSTCQDCHMRDVTGRGCNDVSAPLRSDLPFHDMTGGNAFMGPVVASLYPTQTDAGALADGAARAVSMLGKAASLVVSADAAGDSFTVGVRVTNRTGHKLPTGYPEGRRMWIHLVARDGTGNIVYESCAYDSTTGVLTQDASARIYEANLGLSPGLAASLGLPQGPGFHFALNDTLYKDNRIPPEGFSNAAYATFGGAPVDPGVPAPRYADGQNWDVASYAVPSTARSAVATLYYQTTSKDYVEFLGAQNSTNGAGTTLLGAWAANRRSKPVAMAERSLSWSTLGTLPDAAPRVLSLRALANPSRGALAFELGLPLAAEVSLEIYDVAGRLVSHAARGRMSAGTHRVTWSGRNATGRDAGAGVFWAVVRVNGGRLNQRFVRLD